MKTASIILLLLFPLTILSQDNVDAALRELTWNEYYQLQWDDFQGEPDPRSQGDAATSVQIKAKPFLVRKKIHYDVTAIFNRAKSWYRDRSASLLAHEQLHFDIAELYARKIRRRIEQMSDQGINNIKTYNAAIHELLLESNEVDQRYDIETLHGSMSRKQDAWSQKVKEELASLKEYRKTKRVIGG